MRSFLLIGQSNMAGRGALDEAEPLVNDRCFMFRMGRWLPMREPINIDSVIDGEYPSGVGLSASFADAYAKHFGDTVGLIPCAVGDTAIRQWMPGGFLYENAVFTARYAMKTSQIAGILWHQGENDAEVYDEAAYADAFRTLMSRFRKDLGGQDIPLVIGELSECIDPKWNIRYAPEMNALLHRLSEETPCCAIASAKGLTLKRDGVHFSSPSYRILGKRYFESYLTLLEA